MIYRKDGGKSEDGWHYKQPEMETVDFDWWWPGTQTLSHIKCQDVVVLLWSPSSPRTPLRIDQPIEDLGLECGLPVSIWCKLLLLRLSSLRSLESRNCLALRCLTLLLDKSIFTISDGRSDGTWSKPADKDKNRWMLGLGKIDTNPTRSCTCVPEDVMSAGKSNVYRIVSRF